MGQGISSGVPNQVADCQEQVAQGEDQKQDPKKQTREDDFTLFLPNGCLELIFKKLGAADRNACSLVCKHWHDSEAQGRYNLSLIANNGLVQVLPSLLLRFGHVTKLVLKCNKGTPSIGDEAMLLVAKYCKHLKKLKLNNCRELTDDGIEAFSCFLCSSPLRKLSISSCDFGAGGLNALLCSFDQLASLKIKRLRGLSQGPNLIRPGKGGLRRLCLKEIPNAQLFGPLIVGCSRLQSLRMCANLGNWDAFFEIVAEHLPNLTELHLERLNISDRGLRAVSVCTSLEVLHVLKAPECTNFGLSAIAHSCHRMKRLHLDSWRSRRIGDEGLIAVAKKCRELQELVLIGVDVSIASLLLLASNCPDLERLAVCNCESFGDLELSCLAAKFSSLKKFCIKSCPVTDQGIETLICGCPNLRKLKVSRCASVTSKSLERLQQFHGDNLSVSLENGPNSFAGDQSMRSTRSRPGRRRLGKLKFGSCKCLKVSIPRGLP